MNDENTPIIGSIEDGQLPDVSSDVAAEPSPLPPVAPTASELLAEELLGILNDFAARIPGLVSPHASTALTVRRGRTVPKAFMRSAIFTVQESGSLQAIGTLSIDDAREALQFVEAFRVVAERLRILTTDLNFTIDWKTSLVADATLRVYAISKAMARDPNSGNLGGHNAFLKKHLGRKGRGSKVKTPPPDAAPNAAP